MAENSAHACTKWIRDIGYDYWSALENTESGGEEACSGKSRFVGRLLKTSTRCREKVEREYE